MHQQYYPGAWVRVDAAFGERLSRRVVSVANGRVYVCTDEEYRAAKRDRRGPVAVGFRIEKVHPKSA